MGCLNEPTFIDVEMIARYAGLSLKENAALRSGKYLVIRGGNILHHADDLKDIKAFVQSWAKHVL